MAETSLDALTAKDTRFAAASRGWGHLVIWNEPIMGHLNSFSASGWGNLNKNFPKIQMPGGLPGGGVFKLRFGWYINYARITASDTNHLAIFCISGSVASALIYNSKCYHPLDNCR